MLKKLTVKERMEEVWNARGVAFPCFRCRWHEHEIPYRRKGTKVNRFCNLWVSKGARKF